MAQLLAFDMTDVQALIAKPLEALATQDILTWRAAYEALRKHEPKPEDYSEDAAGISVGSFDGRCTLSPVELPSRTAVGIALLAYCLRLTRKRVFFGEDHPTLTYPNLDEEDALSEDLANTDSWE